MIESLLRRIAAEVRLHRHNRLNRKGVVSESAQNYFVLHDILPKNIHEGLCSTVQTLNDSWVSKSTAWRSGSAIGGHELKDSVCAPWLEYLTSSDFLEDVRTRTGLANLDLVPEQDMNRMSLLSYSGAEGTRGDGADWHMDGSIYLGDRWAGILVLEEETSEVDAKLELKPHGNRVVLPAAEMKNTLILFQGDHVEHRVRPMLPGEERVVISLLFSTWPVMTLNPLLRRYQARVNREFYDA